MKLGVPRGHQVDPPGRWLRRAAQLQDSGSHRTASHLLPEPERPSCPGQLGFCAAPEALAPAALSIRTL